MYIKCKLITENMNIGVYGALACLDQTEEEGETNKLHEGLADADETD